MESQRFRSKNEATELNYEIGLGRNKRRTYCSAMRQTQTEKWIESLSPVWGCCHASVIKIKCKESSTINDADK